MFFLPSGIAITAQTHPYFMNPGFYRIKDGSLHIRIAPQGQIFFSEKDLSNPVTAQYSVYSSIRSSYKLTLTLSGDSRNSENPDNSGTSSARPVIRTLPAILEPESADAYQFSFSRDANRLTIYLMKKNIPYKKLDLERFVPR